MVKVECASRYYPTEEILPFDIKIFPRKGNMYKRVSLVSVFCKTNNINMVTEFFGKAKCWDPEIIVAPEHEWDLNNTEQHIEIFTGQSIRSCSISTQISNAKDILVE